MLSSNRGFIIRPFLLNLIFKNDIILFLVSFFLKKNIYLKNIASFIAYKNFYFGLYSNLLANNLALF